MRKLESTAGLLLVLLMTTFSTQAAEYYTWVDENGVVNFSERDPQEYNAELVSNRRQAAPREFGYQRPLEDEPEETAPAATENAPETAEGDDGGDADIEAQIAAEKNRVNAEIAKVKKSNCAIGKRNLAQLESYSRVRVADENGGQRMLSDDEKQQRIQQARETIRENCTG